MLDRREIKSLFPFHGLTTDEDADFFLGHANTTILQETTFDRIINKPGEDFK